MKKSDLLKSGIIGIMVSLMASGLSAQDFAQWRGVNRDGNVNNFKSPAKWPSELKQEWKVTVGSGDASPVQAGNRLFIFTRQDSSEILRCLDSGTGREIWESKYKAVPVTGPAAFSGRKIFQGK